jgi:hypothetical protein
MNRATGRRPVPSDPGRSISYVLLSGLAWGIVVTTFESLSQPPLDLSLSEYLTFYSRILLHFGAGGILLALLTGQVSKLDASFLKWIAVVASVAAAMGLALLLDWLSIRVVPFWKNDPMAVMWRLSDLAAYMAWIFAVYGGLYLATFLFLANEGKSRELLRASELARIGAEDRMDRALAQDNEPAVAPDLLLRALSELTHRYDENHRRADRLLDKLVHVLRSANTAGPNLIAAKSRMARGPDIAASVSELWVELGAGRARSNGRRGEHHTRGGRS